MCLGTCVLSCTTVISLLCYILIMGLISESIWVNIFMVVATVIVGTVTYFIWSFKYWEKKNVPYMQPKIPFGTLNGPFNKAVSLGEHFTNQYNESRARGLKHVGLYAFAKPMYMVIHPEYVKNVLTRDFDHFVDHGIYYNEQDDPLSASLFFIEGNKWRNLRAKLTPTFTSGKMKMMFQTLVGYGNQLIEVMDDISTKNDPANVKDVVSRFTTDIIGSCAFGLDCNTCKDPDSEFRIYGKKIFTSTKLRSLKGFVTFAAPSVAKLFRFCTTQRDVADFFMKVVRSTVEYRETNNVVRKDLMQLLIELKNGKDSQEMAGLTIEELGAQAFGFFIAGYETASTAMTFCLYELAVNQNIQLKLREEVNEIFEKHDGKFSYDAMLEMKYMGQVIDETLRKYPPVPVLNRVCVKDYLVPGTDVVIEKGTYVLVPTLGLQRDAEYHPDPEKFDPERFSEKNKKHITPFTYIPFGEGPRACIGLRFGIMQTKVGLAFLLKNYEFSLNEKTISPLQMNPRSFILSALGDVWLNVQKVSY